jgi:probable F420-dependent oxidoreductase
MELAFTMPHIMEVEALVMPWERSVTGLQMRDFARWADKLGYAMISVAEHFVMPNQHLPLSGAHHVAAYPSMAYFAGATERIRVNSGISLLPLVNPLVTAKTLSTMDWLTGGRVSVTFASGWCEGEFEALGVDFHQRGAMAEEYVQAIIALWTQESCEFEGRYVKFRDVAMAPKCFRQPHLPIWFGGDSEPVLKRIGRYASGWAPFLTPPEEIPARLDFIRSQPDYSGQLKEVSLPFAITRIGENHVAIDDPAGRAGQERQAIIDRLSWFAELGVTMSSIPIPHCSGPEEYYDYTQWIAEEIMPVVK